MDHAKVNGEWKSVDGADAGLVGLGGWATITSVWNGSGTKPNRYAYGNWVAFEWNGDGSLDSCWWASGLPCRRPWYVLLHLHGC